MNLIFMRLILWTCVVIACVTEGTFAQMVDPSIDRPNEPFCYFSQPTDVIGVKDGCEGTLITPEGYLYTGFGELMFFTGNPPIPVKQRVKTLFRGYLPVVEYSFVRDMLTYHMQMFAATLDDNPESPLMNFVRVTVENPGENSRIGYLAAATRYQNDVNTDWGGVGDHRFGRPAIPAIMGQYEQAGEKFNEQWEYAFGDGEFLRDGKVMYMFPENVPHVTMMTLHTGYNGPPDRRPGKKAILPTTPVGIVFYELRLPGHGKMVIEFRMPYEPLSGTSPFAEQLRNADFDTFLSRLAEAWEGISSRGLTIDLPEKKVVDTFKANLVYDLIARDKEHDFYIQKVNEFQYDAFWLRDASFIVRSYDLTGYHDIARECLDFFPRWQQPDGNFVSQGGQFDGWGQSLWAFGQHYRITGDKAFAESVYPMILKAVSWLHAAREADPFHVMPVTSPGDNEDITGHVTGHNFWALIGLKQAVILAKDLGRSEDAQTFQREYDELHESLLQRLHTITAKTGGYIPPGLDSPGGQDWGNMLTLYPEILFDPKDPMVTGTLNATRKKYREGLMTYGDGRWMHHYLTIANTQSEVVRGDQELAVLDLYALLLHTSATHAGFEFCIRPWGDRDFGMNLSPHGWFSARYRALLRNMLIREDDEHLHLLSCISPEWIKEGKPITVRNAPTNFGTLSFQLATKGTRAELDIHSAFTRSPRALLFHFPWFMDVRSITIDGKSVAVGENGFQKLDPQTKKVVVQWTSRKNAGALSYARAVQDFKREYSRRYGKFRTSGQLPD
jgi:hypothetical protein